MQTETGNPYLLLWLEGPLQAWGHDSKFGRRDSLPFPTKSGLLGLLCCARGAGGPEVEWLRTMADLDLQIDAYGLAGRADVFRARQPLLRDFHMVGGGYASSDPWQSLMIPKTSEGKKAVGGGTKMTYRYFLQDAAFAVALQVPECNAAMLAQALQQPVWDLYLGRKCCAPTEFIYQGLFPTACEALAGGARLAEKKSRARVFRIRETVADVSGEILLLNDVPVQFGSVKRYRDRRVTLMEG